MLFFDSRYEFGVRAGSLITDTFLNVIIRPLLTTLTFLRGSVSFHMFLRALVLHVNEMLFC